jgi:hypothetical protein
MLSTGEALTTKLTLVDGRSEPAKIIHSNFPTASLVAQLPIGWAEVGGKGGVWRGGS